MQDNYQWMPETLLEMAEFCDKNNLAKAKDLLLEAAVMLYMCLARDKANAGRDVFGATQIANENSSGRADVHHGRTWDQP